jgi:alpha-L-arabinofuranosidase
MPALNLVVIPLAIVVACSAATLEISVKVDCSRKSDWRIDRLLFGSFQEDHWGDFYPGIYEQYLVNPSFEKWYTGSKETKTQLVFKVENQSDVAYPWQRGKSATSAKFSQSTEAFNTNQSQCIVLTDAGSAAVEQKVALPDYRVLKYRLKLYAKGEGLKLSGGFSSSNDATVIVEKDLGALTGEWKAYEIELDLGAKLTERHINRYGVANLILRVTGKGTASIDQATLFPVDCVDGIYNPETLQHFKTFKPTMVRWPGGNFTSQYHWRDGIGDPLKRPTRPNRAWNGVTPNHLGTDEFIRFCKLTGIEPVMGVGFGEITVGEAADWVEYCNGSADSPMGKLRTQNGHPEPYQIKYWGVGNEVYGSYQIGFTDADTYAKGLREFSIAMKKRVPSIVFIASGLGVHNDYRQKDKSWNEKVIDGAGDCIDMIDAHHYVHGPHTPEDVNKVGIDAVVRAFMASNIRLGEYFSDLQTLLNRSPKTKNIKLAILEWGVHPSAKNNPVHIASFANALCSALQFHEMFRYGNFVKMGAIHNFTTYVQPVAKHADPPHPRTFVSGLYTAFGNTFLLQSAVTNCPTTSIHERIVDVGQQKNVPDIDCVASVADEGTIHVAIVNRSKNEHDIHLSLSSRRGSSAEGIKVAMVSDNMMAEQHWHTAGLVFQTTEERVKLDNNELRFKLPKGSIVYFNFEAPRR